MIFIFPKWRFWNQIFQYIFAKSILKKNEKVFTIKMPYFEIINENNFILFNWYKIYKYFNYFFDKFFLILAKLRIITWIYQNKIIYYEWYSWQNKWYFIKRWLINNLKYIDWFFIYEWKHLKTQSIEIKEKFLKKAKTILNNFNNKNYNIFVHLRRWDYKNWSVLWKTDLTIDNNYYITQIKYFEKKYNCNFIFLSDDIKWCKKEFSSLRNSYFSTNDLWTDFAIMTLCNGWIISPSTLSYIWAYFQNQKIEIFAPNYWLWFKSNMWYPKWIQTKKFSYININ